MSKFSIYLGQLIQKSGEPISKIAKNAGLERTSIHKALKDVRTLPYPALKKLIQYLQLPLTEARELTLYYDMFLQGEETYYVQEEICHLIEDLNQIQFSTFNFASFLPDNLTHDSQMIRGKAEVESVIQGVLHEETEMPGSEINLHLDNDNHLTEMAIKFWKNGREFTVHQVVTLFSNGSGINNNQQNVHIVRKLLPAALLSNNQYYAYYCFARNETQEIFHPFPYYIITPNYLIILNQDCSVAYLHTDTAIVRLYRKHFESLKGNCQPLISYSNDPIAVLNTYIDNTDQQGYFTMMSQPCMGRYYTREIIEKYVRRDFPYRNELIELGVQRFGVLRKLNSNYYTVFTEEGIGQFVEDGVIADLPIAQVLPIEPEDRLLMLRHLKSDIEQDNVCGYIVDIDQLTIPQYLTFTCDPKHGLHIYTINGFVGGSYTCNLHISAANVGQVFCDFIRFLPNNNYVYSKNQTIGILNHYIRILEGRL